MLWTSFDAAAATGDEGGFLEVLQQGVNDGTLRSDVPVQLMSKALFGMVNWTHRWLKPGMRKVDAKQTSEAFCTLFFDGARTKS